MAGLSKVSISDIVQIDRQLYDRLCLRRMIMETHPDSLDALSSAGPAVNELYLFLTAHYLPSRFPKLFRINWMASALVNTHSYSRYPLWPQKCPRELLRVLGSLIDEDFMILEQSPHNDGYILTAYLTCFASGFQINNILGKTLPAHHEEVPGYHDKLQSGMERWFSKLQVGKVFRRSNVSPKH
jgi:hypothetical protein